MKIKLKPRPRFLQTFMFKVIMYSTTVAVLSVVIALMTTTEQSVYANNFDSTSTLENSNFVMHDSTSQLLMIEKKKEEIKK